MLRDNHAFSGYSINNLDEAEKFYSERLGLDVEKDEMGLSLKLAGGNNVFLYPKENHEPATFTVLNFEVDDIDQAIEDLSARGVNFIHYGEELGMPQDEKGVVRGREAHMGPDIAWFNDPAGNTLAILQE